MELIDWAWRQLAVHSVTGEGLVEWHGYLAGLVPEAELLRKVRPLLDERPQLWASHHLLAQQWMRTGDHSAARDLLVQATVHFASTPIFFLDLADACRALNECDEEVRAAEAALRINPGWTRAVIRVSEAYQNLGKHALAQSSLERGLNFHPRSATLMSALARLTWRQGDLPKALQQARCAVEFDPASEDAWQTYASFARTLQRGSTVTELARELAKQRPWNARVWVQLGQLLADEGHNLASIAALEEALEREPDAVDAIVMCAQAFTKIGKKAQALALCERQVSNYFDRGALLARRAWVLWQFGDLDAACLAMRLVLADHPDQLWGHRLLVDWETEREQYPSAVRLARQLTELSPLNAVSYGYLGAAERQAKDPEAAWRAFSDAARLDPSYAYAGLERLDLALSEQRFDRAEAVIEEQGAHVPAHIASRFRVTLACARDDVTSALDAVRELAKHPATPEHAFAGVDAHLQKLAPEPLESAFASLVRESGLHRELGSLWVHTLHSLGRSPSVFACGSLGKANTETFETAARAYFELLGASSPSWLRVVFSVAWLGRRVYRSDEVWGKVGYVLLSCRAYVLAQLWLANYARRPSLEAWMLQNFRVAALENHQAKAAWLAAEHALTLPADNSLAPHLAFAAFGRAVSGNLEGAREILTGRTGHGLTGRNAWLFESAQKLLELADATTGEARAVERSSLRRRVLTGGHIFNWFSSGTLARWLADGVLRQSLDLYLLLFRYGLWLAAAAFFALMVYGNANATSWGFALTILTSTYLVRRAVQ